MAKPEETSVAEVEQEPAPLVRRHLAKPAPLPLAVERCPEINDWPMALRELPRQNGLMLEDFGFSKSSLAHTVMKAKKGGKEAIEKIEPIRQAFIDLMGFDTEMRETRTEEGDKIPLMVPGKNGAMEQAFEGGRPQFETEERSRWGVRAEGPDLIVTAAKSIRPVAANWKRLVERHFYALVVILDWVQSKPSLLIGKGRKHPEPELAKEAHGALLAKNNKGQWEHPTRKAGAAFAAEYMAGKKAEWGGED